LIKRKQEGHRNHESLNLGNIRIFPNPFKDKLLIDFANSKKEGEQISIYIFNFEGKLQKSITQKVYNNQISISLRNLKAGPYIIRIDQRSLNVKNKIIIKE